MTIRPAVALDADDLERMARDFVASSPYGALLKLDSSRVRDLIDAMLESEDAMIFVAQGAGGDVVGMIALQVLEHPMSGDQMATELVWWVDPARRGTAGVRLLRIAEMWAKSRGATLLQMVAPDARVGEFYAAVGYQAAETAYMKRI